MESVHKVKYNIRDLSTRSVTLFLSRAQIFRDIANVPLKPGSNEITIHGLSPTVDDQSIKVEGSGSAIISDIAVEPLPNHELFKDAYPEEEGLTDSDSEDELDSDSDSAHENEQLAKAKAELQTLLDNLDRANQLCVTAAERQRILQNWGGTLSCEFGADIEDAMTAYQDMRDDANNQHASGMETKRKLAEPIRLARRKVEKMVKVQEREKKRAAKERRAQQAARRKEKQTAKREKQEALEEKRRLRAEKQKFWPRYCYSVRIQLEVGSYTPATSRRASFSSDLGASAVDLGGEAAASQGPASTCNLVLSYVTTSAFWSPSYDLQLSTTNSTGRLCFDAQLHNTTSETWDKCKITLSTSQTVFGGVEEAAPSLAPWKIQLVRGGVASLNNRPILKSRAEQEQKQWHLFNQTHTGIFKNRSDMFGTEGPNARNALLEQQNKKKQQMAQHFQASKKRDPNNATVPSMPFAGYGMNVSPFATHGNTGLHSTQNALSAFGNTATTVPGGFGSFAGSAQAGSQSTTSASLFGSAPPQQQQAQQQQAQQQQAQQQQASEPAADEAHDSSDGDEEDAQLDYPESMVEETGFSTQYDLAGEKRLEPRSHASKQRVAQINFTNIAFSHTVVAKYKPAAYLSAKLINSSKLTLLKGAVGVTLDGSFMGRTNLPRCVGGESINLGLGVDPAIKVIYAPPEGKRATTGFFTKEDITIYDRVVRLENTRSAASASAAVKLVVLDQIPLPREDKIRVELIQPEGLVMGGEEGKPAGEPGRARKEEDKDWGSAKSYLRKNGEVVWYVTLKSGKAVRLDMRYSVATPIGDQAQEVPS